MFDKPGARETQTGPDQVLCGPKQHPTYRYLWFASWFGGWLSYCWWAGFGFVSLFGACFFCLSTYFPLLPQCVGSKQVLPEGMV